MFTVPNLGTTSIDAQAQLDSGDLAILAAGVQRTGIVAGCAVAAQGTPNMSVAVAAGSISISGGGAVAVAAATVVISAADITNPRFDLILADAVGTLSVLTSTPAPSPAYPPFDNTAYAVLAAVYVPAGATAITAGDIVDKRVGVASGAITVPDPIVLQFPGASDSREVVSHVNHGHFWPATTNLGPFMWQCWCAPGPYSEFWVSESASGAHALLAGFSDLAPIGNIWNGVLVPSQGGIGFAGDYLAAAGEWLQDTVSWDGTWLYRHINGVPVGRWPFAGPRQAFSGNFYAGGSDHSNFRGGKVVQIRGYELAEGATSGLPLDFAFLSTVFRPEIPMGDWSGPGDVVGVKPNFLATYQRPALTVPDESNGYGGKTHTGILSGKSISFGPYPGQEGHPKPSWVVDPTCPFRTDVLPASLALVPAPLPVPAGARIYDSGGRANSDFAFSPIPSLGSTEGGSLGPQAWSGDGEIGVGSAHWVLQRGQAVYAGQSYGVKLVDNGSPDMSVRVTRRLVDADLHHTGLAVRAVDDSNGWFCNTYQQFGHTDPQHVIVRIAPWTAGVSASPTDFNAPATLWRVLRVDASGTTITVYVDDLAGGWTQIGQITGASTFSTATKCGLATGYGAWGLHRFFPFEVRVA